MKWCELNYCIPLLVVYYTDIHCAMGLISYQHIIYRVMWKSLGT
jgi:hypothetical protein